jgi:hypothetical protein
MIDDQSLIRAARKRILRELAGQHENAGSAGSPKYAGGGLMEKMNGGQSDNDDLFSYLVDIEKNDKRDPETGKTIGWTKKVHRHREPRGGEGK